MAIAAAAPTLIERVDPNCAMDTVALQASWAASDNPCPSCPKNRTHDGGISNVSSEIAPETLSRPMMGTSFSFAQADSASTDSWWRMF